MTEDVRISLEKDHERGRLKSGVIKEDVFMLKPVSACGSQRQGRTVKEVFF